MKGFAAGKLVVGASIIALVLSSVAIGWLVYGYESTQVTVTAVDWHVLENGSSQGYVCAGSCVGVPIHTTVGALLSFPLHLFGTTHLSGLSVQSVSAAPGFALVGVYPALPATVPQGAYVTFSVTVQAPASPGSYDFTGTILASYG